VSIEGEGGFCSVEESDGGSVIDNLDGAEAELLGILDEESYISSSAESVVGSKYCWSTSWFR
jgi:hypothetical protein